MPRHDVLHHGQARGAGQCVDMFDAALSAMEAAGWPVGQRSYTMEALKALVNLGWQLIPPREELKAE
jgi:hypothetical protein